MKDLIERLEKAAAPDRELDVEIFAIADVDAFSRAVANAKDLSGPTPHQRAPGYTSSIDAALTLVPEVHVGHVGFTNPLVGRCHAKVWPMAADHTDSDCVMEGSGINPAIALCIAALRARESSAPRSLEKLEAGR